MTYLKKPKLSIGMPIYNAENFLRNRLDSLLSQKFSDFELIISDNASTDLTEQICKEYLSKDNRIQYFRQEKNIGLSKTIVDCFFLVKYSTILATLVLL